MLKILKRGIYALALKGQWIVKHCLEKPQICWEKVLDKFTHYFAHPSTKRVINVYKEKPINKCCQQIMNIVVPY